MNLSWIDWSILIALFLALNFAGFLCRKSIKGVADFLVAGRNVGRFLGLGSDSMAAMGAVTILALWQMNYKAGFAGQWWYMLVPIVAVIVAVTGWGVYRYRQTRAMTLGQLIEMRYSKKTRIFFGVLAYLAGILNMGIFPAVGAGFFVHYCGLPEKFILLGTSIPTTIPIMIIIVGSAVVICFLGGQVTLIVTDFIQSAFVNIMLIGIMIIIYRMFTWEQFAEAYNSAPNSEALIHPFRSEGASEFNKFFFFITSFWFFYNVISWGPIAMQIGSAKDAHEAQMMRMMTQFKNLAMIGLGIMFLPLAVFVFMNHPDFADQAAQVTNAISSIENEQVRSQMLTPAAIVHILPTGFLGAFAGIVLFAFISTHDTYLLAWGGLLIQDVIIPIKKTKLTPKEHLIWLKLSVLAVAVFIILFSIFFNQVDNIFMFFDISASLYMGSAGVVILGALYWKRGTTEAAWITMITGAVLSISGFIYRQINPDFLDGRIMAFYVAIICIVTYIVASLFSRKPNKDLDKILHRDPTQKNVTLSFYQNIKNIFTAQHISKNDKFLLGMIILFLIIFLSIFVLVCVYNVYYEVPVSSWLNFWHIYIYAMFAIGSVFLTIITIGGIRDLIRLFISLKTKIVDYTDDGSVNSENLTVK